MNAVRCLVSAEVIPSYSIHMRTINSSPPSLTSNLQCWWAALEYHWFNFPWISRHDQAVLCETRHQDGLMGLEIYAGTIWAALAFKLQSGGEMGNDNSIKIKRISNWPSQWELAQSLSADRPLLYCGESCSDTDVRTSRSDTLSPSSHLRHDTCG